jgi:hypothetical protein
VEGDRPTFGLVMVGGIRAGTGTSIVGRGAVSQGAGDQDGVGTAGMPAPSERLKVVHGQRGSADR